MATATLNAAAEAFYTQWTLGAGGTKVAAVLPPNDDDTTYITTGGSGTEKETFTVTALPAASSIQQVDLYYRVRASGAGAPVAGGIVRLGGTDNNVGSHSLTSSYSDQTESAVSRPGGGSWVPGDFPPAGAVEMGVRQISGTNPVRCTTITLTVTYTPTAGSSTWLISMWLPPLLSVASHGLLKREMEAILSCLKIRPSSREEWAMLRDAFCHRKVFV